MKMMPTGFRFNPTDEELIQILERKVYGKDMPLHGHFIVERNVYEFDPQDLEWDHTVAIHNNDRYCFCMKENDSREVSGRGWWRATGHVKTIYAEDRVVGYKRPLTFHRFMDSHKKRNKAVKTNWIMHEYSLEANTTIPGKDILVIWYTHLSKFLTAGKTRYLAAGVDWRLCKIKYKGKQSVQEEPENNRKGCTSRNDIEPSSSIVNNQSDFVGEQPQQPQAMELDNLYEPYIGAISSMGMNQFCLAEEQLQSQLLQLDNICELYFNQNMQLEVVDEKLQQSKPSYDPYCFDGLLEQQPDSSEQLFFSLWSWQN